MKKIIWQKYRVKETMTARKTVDRNLQQLATIYRDFFYPLSWDTCFKSKMFASTLYYYLIYPPNLQSHT